MANGGARMREPCKVVMPQRESSRDLANLACRMLCGPATVTPEVHCKAPSRASRSSVAEYRRYSGRSGATTSRAPLTAAAKAAASTGTMPQVAPRQMPPV